MKRAAVENLDPAFGADAGHQSVAGDAASPTLAALPAVRSVTMTPLRQRETLEAELASLQELLQSTPDDPLATPLMRERVEELEHALKALTEHPPLTPEAELFFADGPAMGSEGLEVTFTSEVLNSYQNMVTNHYAAKHYGAPRRSGRRRGEDETRLFLTALPRGSFGLQLSQPHVPDFYTAQNVTGAMQEISGLIEATAASDDSFEAALAAFDARVFKPLTSPSTPAAGPAGSSPATRKPRSRWRR